MVKELRLKKKETLSMVESILDLHHPAIDNKRVPKVVFEKAEEESDSDAKSLDTLDQEKDYDTSTMNNSTTNAKKKSSLLVP